LKIVLLAVGKPGALLRDAIQEYEERAARYWSFEAIEVREEKATKGSTEERVREQEAERLLSRVPSGSEIVALTRGGRTWSSAELAKYLQEKAIAALPAVCFLIGGAYGLGGRVLDRSATQLSLSSFTLPHELARLFLVEQIYRAGTIARGEPYHKARP
jgi:23S rRNA (pseudouridine1915-N3)-methyltransferase